jgi:hypothetical protein
VSIALSYYNDADVVKDTAFVANRGGWLYCDDSRVVPADPKDVVVRTVSCVFILAH